MNETGQPSIRELRGSLYLEVSARLSMDASRLMEKYTGRLILSARGDEYLVGRTRYWVVRVGEMLNRGMDPLTMLDGEDTDTADFCDLFLTEELDWPKPVRKVCPDAVFGDLAILDRLIVNPPFRGRKIDLHCIEMIIRIVGGMGLFAMKPFPLQHNPKYRKDPDVARGAGKQKADLSKLIRYYEPLGFRKLPGTELMALDPRVVNPPTPWEDGDGEAMFARTEAMEAYRLPAAERDAADAEREKW